MNQRQFHEIRPSFPTLTMLIIAIVASLVYFPVLDNTLLEPSRELTIENPQVTGDVPVSKAWFTPTPPTSPAKRHYQPVLTHLLRAEYKLWGRSPSSYHAIGLILFIACVCMLGAVTGRLTSSGFARIVAPLAFAFHPMVSQSVQTVAAQGILWSLAGTLTCCYLYLRWVERRIPVWLACLLMPFATLIAMGTHEIGMLLPLWLLPLLVWRPTVAGETVTEAPQVTSNVEEQTSLQLKNVSRLPFAISLVLALIAGGILLALRAPVYGSPMEPGLYYEQFSASFAGGKLSTGIDMIAMYLGRLTWPISPTLIAAPPLSVPTLAPIIAKAIVAVLVILAIFALVRRSVFGIALCWMLLGVAALSQWIPLSTQYSEAPLAFAVAGLALGLGVLAGKLIPGPLRINRFSPVQYLTLALLLVLGCGMLWQVAKRNPAWNNTHALWNAEANNHPDIGLPKLELLKLALLDKNFDTVQSLIDTLLGMELNTLEADRLALYRISYHEHREEPGSIRLLIEASLKEDRPHIPNFWKLVDALAVRNGLEDLTPRIWQRAYEETPEDFETCYRLARIRFDANDLSQALVLGDEALALAKSPEEQAKALTLYGIILAGTNRTNEAIENLRQSLVIDPTQYKPYEYLARLYWGHPAYEPEARYLMAENMLRSAMDRARVDTYRNIAAIFVTMMEEQGKHKRADIWVRSLRGQYPDDLPLMIFAGRFFIENKDYEAAREYFTHVVKKASGTRSQMLAEGLVGMAWLSINVDDDLPLARRMLADALQILPDSEEARQLMAYVNEHL